MFNGLLSRHYNHYYEQGKLDDERTFYENQLQSSDASFKELEVKMREYEELLLASEKVCGSSNGSSVGVGGEDKLSTIVETVSLEGQVTDLEEEIETLRSQLRTVQAEGSEAAAETERNWQQKLETEIKAFQTEREQTERQVSTLQSKLGFVESELSRGTYTGNWCVD